MKCKAITGLICCTALLGLPAAAQAHGPIHTGIVIDGSAAYAPGFDIIGHLTSHNPKCLAGRTVKIFIGSQLVDTDVSSTIGVWAGANPVVQAGTYRATVTRKTFGRKKHRRTCAPATASVLFA